MPCQEVESLCSRHPIFITTRNHTSMCRDDKHISLVRYNYTDCRWGLLSSRVQNNITYCQCHWTLLQCSPDHRHTSCENLYQWFAYTELSMLVLGLLFNILVIGTFCRRSWIRRKTANILLLNISLVDMMYCFGFTMTQTIITGMATNSMHFGETLKVNDRFNEMVLDISVVLTVSLSLFSFLLSSLERLVSVLKPNRHDDRRNLLWKFICGVWAFSVLLAFGEGFVSYDHNFYPEGHSSRFEYNIFLLLLVCLTITLTISLFVLTYHCSQKMIKRSSIYANNTEYYQTSVRSRKERIRTHIFLVMYILFLACFLPLLTLTIFIEYTGTMSQSVFVNVRCILLTVPVMINPCLVFCWKNDFKPRSCQRCINRPMPVTHEFIEMTQVAQAVPTRQELAATDRNFSIQEGLRAPQIHQARPGFMEITQEAQALPIRHEIPLINRAPAMQDGFRVPQMPQAVTPMSSAEYMQSFTTRPVPAPRPLPGETQVPKRRSAPSIPVQVDIANTPSRSRVQSDTSVLSSNTNSSTNHPSIAVVVLKT